MSLHIRRLGEGPTPVLALHCGLGMSSMWKGLAKRRPDLSITAPDLPGHGRSAPFPDGDVHDSATAALRPLVDGPLHLIGHSFGATLALRLALEAPEKVLSLTLIEPVFFAAAADSAIKADHRRAEEGFFAIAGQGDGLATAAEFNRLWGGGVPWDSFEPEAQQAMAAQMPFVVATEPSLWQDRAGMLRPGGLEGLSCPVTLIRGAETVPIMAEVHRGLMARLPHTREVVVPEAGHMVLLSHGNAIAQALEGQIAAPVSSL